MYKENLRQPQITSCISTTMNSLTSEWFHNADLNEAYAKEECELEFPLDDGCPFAQKKIYDCMTKSPDNLYYNPTEEQGRISLRLQKGHEEIH